MKSLLIITAALEATTGVALLASPSLPASILLGAPLDTLAGSVLGRVAGAALLALGLACWRARNDEYSRAAAGIITAMLLYNVAVAGLLVHARFGAGLAGIALWPAVVLHTALAVWCAFTL